MHEPRRPAASDDEPDADEPDAGPLVAHRQRLGIIPTWRFWTDYTKWGLVRAPAAVLIGVVAFIAAISGLPPLLAGLLGVAMLFFAIGLLERYVRRQAA